MIKAVMFDAGGVLHVSNTAQSDDLKQELGLTDTQLKRFYSNYVPLLGTGQLTEDNLWKKLRKEFGIRKVNVEEHLLTRTFAKTLKKMPGMYELVEDLKAKGITVMLLTNVGPQFAEILESKGHYDPFDFKILSFEVGSWKPDLVIYQHALQKAKLKPEETIFIDDQEKNIIAAETLGIHGIIFQETEQVKKQLDELIK